MIVVGTQPGGGSGGFGGGGGGGYGGFSTYTNDPPPEPTPVCSDIFRAADNEKCSLFNPPTLVRDGCGSGVFDAPDFVVGWSGMGPVLTSACNQHDTCYGAYGESKHGCDNQLRADMIKACQDLVGGPDPRFVPFQDFLRACEAQADLYASGLQSWGIELVATWRFNIAQKEGFCRYLADDARRNQCLN